MSDLLYTGIVVLVGLGSVAGGYLGGRKKYQTAACDTPPTPPPTMPITFQRPTMMSSETQTAVGDLWDKKQDKAMCDVLHAHLCQMLDKIEHKLDKALEAK